MDLDTLASGVGGLCLGLFVHGAMPNDSVWLKLGLIFLLILGVRLTAYSALN